LFPGSAWERTLHSKAEPWNENENTLRTKNLR
jgi:hypothetical protein